MSWFLSDDVNKLSSTVESGVILSVRDEVYKCITFAISSANDNWNILSMLTSFCNTCCIENEMKKSNQYVVFPKSKNCAGAMVGSCGKWTNLWQTCRQPFELCDQTKCKPSVCLITPMNASTLLWFMSFSYNEKQEILWKAAFVIIKSC